MQHRFQSFLNCVDHDEFLKHTSTCKLKMSGRRENRHIFLATPMSELAQMCELQFVSTNPVVRGLAHFHASLKWM